MPAEKGGTGGAEMYAIDQRISRAGRLAAILGCAVALAACGTTRAAEGPDTDVTRASAPLRAEQHNVVSSDGRDPYLSARDVGTGEFIRDIATGEPLYAVRVLPPGPEQHNVLSADGRDPYLSARDPGTGELVRDIATGEPLYAVRVMPPGPAQHNVLSSDGRDPYLSARDPGTGELVRDIATGEWLH